MGAYLFTLAALLLGLAKAAELFGGDKVRPEGVNMMIAIMVMGIGIHIMTKK